MAWLKIPAYSTASCSTKTWLTHAWGDALRTHASFSLIAPWSTRRERVRWVWNTIEGAVHGLLAELCIERVATRRDQFSSVTWLLDAMLSPNAAQPNGQTSLAPMFAHAFLWNKMASNRKLSQLSQYTALLCSSQSRPPASSNWSLWMWYSLVPSALL